MESSDWPSMSMKPGATTLPAASIVRLRGEALRLPMAATFPSRIPRSPEYQGEPAPSMMWPLVMTRSKLVAVDCANTWAAANTMIASNKFRLRSFIDIPFQLITELCLIRSRWIAHYKACQSRAGFAPKCAPCMVVSTILLHDTATCEFSAEVLLCLFLKTDDTYVQLA